MESSDLSPPPRPVVFGEVLLDIFPDGAGVLGGAPFNVAWHLQGFGLNPLFISRIGPDRNGGYVLEKMTEWRMDTSGVQVDKELQTGQVTVSLRDGQPTFTIVPDQAFDAIEPQAALSAVEGNRCSLLYHGTLILRDQSAEALKVLRESVRLPAFVDLNLRSPWWQTKSVHLQLAQAKWAKMNDSELAQVLECENLPKAEQEAAAKRLRSQLGLELLIVTLGADGAFLVTAGEETFWGRPTQQAEVVDTVGAGDAFSAVMILALLNQWPRAKGLERALEFASRVCARKGAIGPDRELYSDHLKRWSQPEN
ncbi:carbohydrate kinase [Acidobacteria bacterium AH-259-O06]|nr:carbohydrate kinase [Acidobacteria bacterium AH-259-O06]